MNVLCLASPTCVSTTSKELPNSFVHVFKCAVYRMWNLVFQLELFYMLHRPYNNIFFDGTFQEICEV